MSLSESIFTMTKHGCFELINPLTKLKERFEFDTSNPQSYDQAHRQLQNRKTEVVSEVVQKIGREPTAREMMQGFVEPSQDSRTATERMKDSDWRPKLRNQPSNIENLLTETEAEIDKQNPYKGMSPLEVRRHDLERMLDREADQKLEAEANKRHREKIQPKLDIVNGLINAENWSNESDEAYRSLLRRTREQLLEPNGDRTETLRMFKKVDAVLAERHQQKTTQLEAKASALADQLAQNQADQQSLAEGMDSDASE